MSVFTTILTATLSAGLAMADSLSVNPTVADADLTTHGSDWLWAAFAVMLASAVGVFAWSFVVPPGHRAFHWIGIAILLTASIAYFTLASNLGSTPIYVEFVRFGSLYSGPRNPYTRSIWYVRYIDWVITTPLLLLELLLGTGMPLSGLFGALFMDEVMIIAGLIGALVRSSYKWGYFTGSCVALFYITWVLLFPARANTKAIGPQAHSAYFKSAAILSFLWLLYPVCWGLADGGNVISTDGEMVFYGVLDILAKPVFLFFHLFSLRKIPYETFQLQSGHFSAYASIPGNTVHNEKRATHNNATTGFMNGTEAATGTLSGHAAPNMHGAANAHVVSNMHPAANTQAAPNMHTTSSSPATGVRAAATPMHVRRTGDAAV